MSIKPAIYAAFFATLIFGSPIIAQVAIRVPLSDSSRWDVLASSDSDVIFAHDYSTDAIPMAPNGSDRIGVKLTANQNLPMGPEEIALLPRMVPRGFDYRMSVDLWGNYAWGTTESRTEFLGGFVGHDGESMGRDGAGFMYSNDGGAARDYRLYQGKQEQFAASGQYAPELFEHCDPNRSENNDCRDDIFDYWNLAFTAMDTGLALEPDFGQSGNPTDYQNFGVAGFQWVTLQMEVSGETETAQVTLLAHGNPESPNTPPVRLNIGTLDLSNQPDALDGRAAIVYADLFRNVAQAPAYSFGIADNFILEFDGAGDFNLDGEYGCEDVDALVAEIASSGNSTTFDLNADGLVDRDDLDLWLMLGGAANLPGNKSYQFGDGNLDGRVDVGDFNVWNGNKFQDVPAWCSGDFNADGVVDISDFNTWNANKFTSADTNTVPEPSSRLVLMVLLSQLGIRSRRTKGKLG